MSGQQKSVRPGSYHVADPKAHAKAAQIVRDVSRPLAKAQPCSERDRHKSTARAAFCHALEELERAGIGIRAIARHLGVDHHTVIDWRDGARPLQAWVFAALPRDGRRVATEFLWLQSEPPSAKTGS